MASLNQELRIQRVNLNVQRRGNAKVLVGQPHWSESDWAEKDHLYTFANEKAPRLWLDSFLQKAQEHACGLILLPELSVPDSLQGILAAWTRQTGSMIIGGSHYATTENGIIARSPVVFAGETHYVEKIHPAPVEVSPVAGKGIIPGSELKVFENTPVGTVGILICSDYLKDDVKRIVIRRHLDVLCIPAFQRDSTTYHKRIDIDVEQEESGLYVLYANNRYAGAGDGRSSAFGIVHEKYREKLRADGYTDSSPVSKLCELNEHEDFFVIELDIEHKRPTVPTTVDHRPNLVVIEKGVCYRPGKVLIPKRSTKPTARTISNSRSTEVDRIRSQIIARTKRLVAVHGLDDPEWSQAFSSMYFLAKLGRLLGMTDGEDYRNLLDNFLRFFNFRANDTLYLRDDQILVTPNENEKIRQQMEEEDKQDPVFMRSPKTRADRINMQLMHENFLYGVALAISASENSKIMLAVRDAALQHLIYEKHPSSRDTHGGWHPYRVPWITARIVVTLADADLSARPDQDHIKNIIDDALESLMDRLQPEGYWRSGVGNWVTRWECTALCLEAFLGADAERRFESLISALFPQLMSHLNEWILASPDFTSDERSNETLAAVMMASVVPRMAKAYSLPDDSESVAVKTALYEFLLQALEELEAAVTGKQRQFCTIPQVAAYCLAAALS